MDSIFKRYGCSIPYLDSNELRALSKSPIPYQSPTGVAEYNGFEDNVLHKNLRQDHVFKLIENQEWNKAIVELKRNNSLAGQWVMNGNTRRLPLHEACVHQPTTEIIYTLLDIYPDGAKSKDSDGRYPIHNACAYGASASTIYQLLYEYPESADLKDEFNQTPKTYALNTSKPNVDVIQALFHKSHSDITKTISSIKRNLAVSGDTYLNNYNIQTQLVPYKNKNSPTKAVKDSVSVFHMTPLKNTLEQTDAKNYSAFTQRGLSKQKVVEGITNTHLTGGGIVSKDRVDVNSHRNVAFSQMSRIQNDSRKIVGTRNEYAEVERLQDENNGLKAQLSQEVQDAQRVCTERDRALVKVTQLENKIIYLESQIQNSKDSKQIMMKKDGENDLLRSINKDLRETIISLSRKLHTLTKDLEETKKNSSTPDKLVNEVKRLHQYRHLAENKIEELKRQESAQAEMIDKLNDELEELNASYFDVTNALVTKSKDCFMLKAELDQSKNHKSNYH